MARLAVRSLWKKRIVEAEKHTYDGLVEAVRCRADEKPVNDESVRLDINEYLERPKEVLSMFSEALRILDRNTAELMVDRMKDEIDELKVQAEENRARLEEKDSQLEEKDAEIARLKMLLEEQNK